MCLEWSTWADPVILVHINPDIEPDMLIALACNFQTITYYNQSVIGPMAGLRGGHP